MPVTYPLTSDRNLTPTSTALVSFASATTGVTEGSQKLYVVPPAGTVENDQEAGVGSEFPLGSAALTVAVYAAPAFNAAPGVRVAVCVESTYVTAAETATL